MLLVECNVLEKVEVINEGQEGNTRLRLRGKFQQCDEQNNNGRIYPRSILESQVKAIQEKIGDRSLVGALDHPSNDAIHLSQASHLITGLSVGKDGSVMGECEILSTPNGKIVEALINDGVKIGISSRGVGSVTEGIKGKIVNEDFKLITFDLVSDPSTRGAFPELSESMRENSERAQAIVSKHKKDRVLLTMLESKISEALKGKQKKIDKNKNNKIDSEDFKMLRGEKKDDDSMDEKSFPDLSGDGKVTMKDVLMGRGVIKGKKKKKKKKNEAIVTKHPNVPKNEKRVPKNYKPVPRNPNKEKREDSSIDIRAAVVEGLKKVCWGDNYNEATRLRTMSKGTPAEQKRARQEGAEMARRVGSHRKTNRALKKGKKVTDPRFAKQVTPKKGSGQFGNRAFKNQDIERQEREDSSIDIRAAVLEGFKKVCWGDKFYEATRLRTLSKSKNPEARKDARKLGAKYAKLRHKTAQTLDRKYRQPTPPGSERPNPNRDPEEK